MKTGIIKCKRNVEFVITIWCWTYYDRFSSVIVCATIIIIIIIILMDKEEKISEVPH